MLTPLVVRLFRHCTAAAKSVADGRHTRGAAIAVSAADGHQTMNGTP